MAPKAFSTAKAAEKEIDPDDDLFFITWVPNPRLKSFSNNQRRNYERHLRIIFYEFHRCMSAFAISPELTSAGNVHYHGWYQLDDVIKWYGHLLPRMKHLGFIKIDLVKNRNELTFVYYRKSMEEMEIFFDDLPVPYTHLCERFKRRMSTYKPDLALEQENFTNLLRAMECAEQYTESNEHLQSLLETNIENLVLGNRTDPIEDCISY